ncbi:MAG: hypothetical protein ACC608_09520 [Anaerofustis sp.]
MSNLSIWFDVTFGMIIFSTAAAIGLIVCVIIITKKITARLNIMQGEIDKKNTPMDLFLMNMPKTEVDPSSLLNSMQMFSMPSTRSGEDESK